jgi:glucose 1-dehydrogenase
MQPLTGKTALVTGASAGIGRATALALAEAGADVALNYLTYPEAAKETAERIGRLGRRVLLYPVDVASEQGVQEMVDDAAARFGRLDIYVSNAAHSDEALFCEADMADFRRTVDVTLWGAFYGLRAAAAHMVRRESGGNLVFISSIHAIEAIPMSMAYNMAKAALDQMARTAALEMAPHRIRVNIVYPGWTDTPGERKYFSEETLQRAGTALPLGRLAQPEDIARGVLFLVDPASDYITGSTLSIDGGTQLAYWSGRGHGEF